MLLHAGRKRPPFEQPGWTYELKHDGCRLIAGVERRGIADDSWRAGATTCFPEVTRGLAGIVAGRTSLMERYASSTTSGAATSSGSGRVISPANAPRTELMQGAGLSSAGPIQTLGEILL